MKQLRVEPLSKKFSIAKDHLWCIYDGDQPLFHGTVQQCYDWLDRNEAFPILEDDLEAQQFQTLVPLWRRLVQFAAVRLQSTPSGKEND